MYTVHEPVLSPLLWVGQCNVFIALKLLIFCVFVATIKLCTNVHAFPTQRKTEEGRHIWHSEVIKIHLKKILSFFLPSLLVCWILKQISVPVQTDFYTVFEMAYDFSHVGIAFFFAGWVSLPNSWQSGWPSELMFMYVFVSLLFIMIWKQHFKCTMQSIQVRIFRPPNYMGAVVMGLLVILIGGLLYIRRKNLEFLYNRTYWAIGALVRIDFLTVHVF